MISDRTRIVSAPPSVVVASTTDDVTLRCDATTDIRRSSHLLVTWFRDELPVSEGDRVRITEGGSQFVIKDSLVSDNGIYRCTASNGIDEDSSAVIVTVKGLYSSAIIYMVAEKSKLLIFAVNEINASQTRVSFAKFIPKLVEKMFDMCAIVPN